MNRSPSFVPRASMILILVWFLPFVLSAGSSHPRLLVRDGDRVDILSKISNTDWGRTSWEQILSNCQPYVERHRTDPEWILSRYPMWWEEGKRYTKHNHAYEPSSTPVGSGNAPVPTLRIEFGNVTNAPDNFGYKTPEIEDMVPYDTNETWLMQSTGPGGKKSRARPGYQCYAVQKKFNTVAMNAATAYWVTGDAAYARLAGDLFMQWLRGAYFLEAKHVTAMGLFTDRILADGDNHVMPMAICYDLLYDYLRAQESWRSDLDLMVEPTFVRAVEAAIHNGSPTVNWNILKMTSFVGALVLDQASERDRLLEFLVSKDFVSGTWKKQAQGVNSIPTVLSSTFSAKGVLQEVLGYHAISSRNMIYTATMAERCGYPAFGANPTLYQLPFAPADLCFPDGRSVAAGDGGRIAPDKELITCVYAAAQASGRKDVMDRAAKLLKGKRTTGIWSLVWGPDAIEEGDAGDTGLRMDRAETIEHMPLFIQRNGADPREGLMMSTFSGGSYNHSHRIGLSMELYGKGYVLGTEPGNAEYGAASFHGYYAVAASHNVLVCNGWSQRLDEFGPTRSRSWLNVREPEDRRPGINASVTFVDCGEVDVSPLADGMPQATKRRLHSVVRTSPTTGYYVDVFRSDFPGTNDYLYHNLGHGVTLVSAEGAPLPLVDNDADYANDRPMLPQQPSFPGRVPGWKWWTKKKSTGWTTEGVNATFEVDRGDVSMVMRMLGGSSRRWTTAFGLQTTLAPRPFHQMDTPLVAVRAVGECWTRPFVAVYEPVSKNVPSISRIRRLEGAPEADTLQAFAVEHDGALAGSTERIFCDVDSERAIKLEGVDFRGTYAVVATTSSNLASLYLGNGTLLAREGFRLEAVEERPAALSLERTATAGVWRFGATGAAKVTIRHFNADARTEYRSLKVSATSTNGEVVACEAKAIPDAGVITVGWGSVELILSKGEDVTLKTSP